MQGNRLGQQWTATKAPLDCSKFFYPYYSIGSSPTLPPVDLNFPWRGPFLVQRYKAHGSSKGGLQWAQYKGTMHGSRAGPCEQRWTCRP